MTQGIKALRKIQLGRESTAGSTSTTVTTIWRGVGGLTDSRETSFSEEDIGILGGALRSHIAMLGGELELEGDACFEQIPQLFDASIHTATPVQDGAGSDYIYTWNVASVSTDLTASSDLTTFSVQSGDNNEVETMHYGFITELTIAGAMGEPLTNSATMVGREVQGGGSFSAATLPSAETILSSKAKLYIDDSTGTIGTTLVSDTMMEFEIKMTTGWMPVMTADGRLDFSFIKRANDEFELSLTYEHNSTASTEKTAWRNQTERAIRIIIEGNAVTSAGTTYSKKTLILDMYGKYSKFEALDEKDGNDTVSATFKVGYSTAAAAKMQVKVVNEVASMP